MTKYSDQHMCMSVCLSVCSHISTKSSAIAHRLSDVLRYVHFPMCV